MNYVPPKGPKRGVSIYSYTELFQLGMTLEDCFLEMQDMGAHGVEILADFADGLDELRALLLRDAHLRFLSVVPSCSLNMLMRPPLLSGFSVSK